MSYSIRWTTEAAKTLNQNLDYLSKEWDEKVINSFLDQIEEVLENIQVNPYLYSIHSSTDKVYKCVIHKRMILYYRIVDEHHIDLLTFWNTYQNLSNLRL